MSNDYCFDCQYRQPTMTPMPYSQQTMCPGCPAAQMGYGMATPIPMQTGYGMQPSSQIPMTYMGQPLQQPMDTMMQPMQPFMPMQQTPLTEPAQPVPTTQPSQVGVEQAVSTGTNILYTQGYLRTKIGSRVKIDFLIGTNMFVDREGTIVDVGISYVVLREVETDDLLVCDLYSIKFVRFYH